MSNIYRPILRLGKQQVVIDRTLIMGIVNASPESFSDGTHLPVEQRLEQAAAVIEAGADIIDIGGQSAVTNQPEVAASTEIDRVLPLVEWLRSQYPDVPVSVDTYKHEVAEACMAVGAAILNDVSGLADPTLIEVCARYRSALVIMHTKARPKQRLQHRDLYTDPAAEVVGFLSAKMQIAIDAGLPPECLIVDPGLDFAKTPHQTVAVLRALSDVRALGRPVLLALSRKDFLGAILRKPPRGRDAGTLAAVAYFAASSSGNIIRVHDVAAARDVLSTIDVLAGRNEIDPDYILPHQLRYEPSAE